MSKRQAEYQGRKETGLDVAGMPSTNPADMPKRATAAQLAQRQIKSARQRKPRSGSPNPTGMGQQQPASNPFGSLDPNATPASPATGGGGSSNGFAFGQSQSFPPATSPSNQQNGSQSFNFGGQSNSAPQFGGGGGSAPSSFNFSTPSFNSGPQQQQQQQQQQQVNNNPFTTSSVTPPSAQTLGPSGFQGFKGNMFSVPPVGSQDNNQNNSGAQSAAGPNGNIFGGSMGPSQQQNQTPQQQEQPAQSSSPFAFGSGATPASTMFSTSGAPASSQNMFSQGGNIFGTSQPAQQAPSKPSDDAMQTSPDGAIKSPGIFGPGGSTQSTPAAPTFGSSMPAPPKFNFGATSSSAASPAPVITTTPSSNPMFNFTASSTPSGGAPLFGAASKPEEAPKFDSATTTAGTPAPSTPAGAPLFGSASKPEEQNTQNTAPGTPSIFSSTPGFPSNGGGGGSTAGNLFGAPNKPQDSGPTNSFFGNQDPQKELSKDTAPPTSTPSKSPSPSLFGAPAFPAPSGGPVFDRKPDQASSATPAGSQTPATTAQSSTLFGTGFKPPTDTSTTTSASTGSTFAPPTGGSTLFGTPKPPATPAAADKAPENKEPPATEPNPLFGGFSQSQAAKPPDASPAFTPFKAPSGPPKEPSTAPPANKKQPLFGKPPSDLTKATDGRNKADSNNNKVEPAPTGPKPNYADQSTQTYFGVKSKWASLLPESIPDHLKTEEEREHYIRMWRFALLNKSFKDQIAQIDPQKEDFDNIVAFYVMLRTQIGIPTELTTLLKPVRPDTPEAFPPNHYPGSKKEKRKAEETDADVSPKRQKPAGPEDSEAPASTATQPQSSTKRKAADEEEDGDESAKEHGGKRTKVNGTEGTDADKEPDSTKPVSDTLSSFASSFIAQKNQGTRAASPSSSESEVSDEDENEEKNQNMSNGAKSAESTSSSSPPSDSSRSLFDRVQVGPEGKPVRQAEEAEKSATEESTAKKDTDAGSALFGGTKFASSFNASGASTPQFSFGASASASRTPSPAKTDAEPAKPASTTGSISTGLNNQANAPFNFKSPSGTSTPSSSSIFTGAANTNAPSSAPGQSIFANMQSQAPTITFGGSSPSPSPAPTPSQTGTSFNTEIQQPKPFAPGQSSSSMLSPMPLSATSSTDASRTNTPAQSDTGADESGEAAENLPQVDLTRGGAGEEGDECLFETRSRGFQLKDRAWDKKGIGLLRILKNPQTGRTRIVLRADPSGNILLNSLLIPSIEYSNDGNAVNFPVFNNQAAPEKWALRVKNETLATEMAKVMQDNKQTGGSA